MQAQLTELELDMLFLFYMLADQFGNVDVQRARALIFHRHGVLIPDKPIKLMPHHARALIDHGVLPDVSDILARVKNLGPKGPRRGRAAHGRGEGKGD